MRNISLNQIVIGAAGLLVLIVLISVGFWMYPSIMNSNNQDPQTAADQKFYASLQEGGRLLEQGDPATALAEFQRLAAEASNPEQEGIAQLNIGVARLSTDKVGAIELLKEVANNSLYAPFTRSKAAYYALTGYYGSKDVDFAKNHLFTGTEWGQFIATSGSVDAAAVEALEFYNVVTPIPEITSRLANEYARLAVEATTDEERDLHAAKAQEYVLNSESLMDSIAKNEEVKYGFYHYTELASAHQQNALALDRLFSIDWLEDAEVVESAYQETINVMIDNNDIGSPSDLYPRYFYADFLTRLSVEENQEAIAKILAPFSQMEGNQNVAIYLRNRLRDQASIPATENNLPAYPGHILEMASISAEFKDALIRAGVDASILE